MTTPAKRQGAERSTSLEGGSQELLPGILDEITLRDIVPRLSWKVFYILTSVNRAWHHAIRTRQVYDARVASRSTETLVVASFSLYGASDRRLSSLWSRVREDPIESERNEIQLRPAFLREDPIESECNDIEIRPASLREDPIESEIESECNDIQIRPAFSLRLSPIPCDGDQWICSDGYIYYFGVAENSYGQRCSNKVFVFDVAGQRAWKVCASMNERRRDFAFGATHGKLYVFGGLSWHIGPWGSPWGNYNHSEFCGSEVYDPKEDRWSPIKPMPTLRFGHRVDIVGDEFFVHGGNCFDPDQSYTAREVKDYYQNASKVKPDFDSCTDTVHVYGITHVDGKDDPGAEIANGKFPEIYHPVKHEWRVTNPFRRDIIGNNSLVGRKSSMDYLFAIEGKLYSIDFSSIHVYGGENSWTHLHSFSFPLPEPNESKFIPDDSVIGNITAAVFVDGQLFVKAVWWSSDHSLRVSGQFETEEFGGESKEIIWGEAPHFFTRHRGYPTGSTQLLQL